MSCLSRHEALEAILEESAVEVAVEVAMDREEPPVMGMNGPIPPDLRDVFASLEEIEEHQRQQQQQQQQDNNQPLDANNGEPQAGNPEPLDSGEEERPAMEADVPAPAENLPAPTETPRRLFSVITLKRFYMNSFALLLVTIIIFASLSAVISGHNPRMYPWPPCPKSLDNPNRHDFGEHCALVAWFWGIVAVLLVISVLSLSTMFYRYHFDRRSRREEERHRLINESIRASNET